MVQALLQYLDGSVYTAVSAVAAKPAMGNAGQVLSMCTTTVGQSGKCSL